MSTSTTPINGGDKAKQIVKPEFMSAFLNSMTPENLLIFFSNRVFILRYRMKSEIPERVFFADGLEDAKLRGRRYCERRKWTFVYVQPFAIDIDALPRPIEEER